MCLHKEPQFCKRKSLTQRVTDTILLAKTWCLVERYFYYNDVTWPQFEFTGTTDCLDWQTESTEAPHCVFFVRKAFPWCHYVGIQRSKNRSLVSQAFCTERLPRASIHQAVKRLADKSREVSKPRDWVLQYLYRSDIWQASRQRCCQCACQISKRSEKFKPESRGFETLLDLAARSVRHLTA